MVASEFCNVYRINFRDQIAARPTNCRDVLRTVFNDDQFRHVRIAYHFEHGARLKLWRRGVVQHVAHKQPAVREYFQLLGGGFPTFALPVGQVRDLEALLFVHGQQRQHIHVQIFAYMRFVPLRPKGGFCFYARNQVGTRIA
ncbi:hypothetical protein [Escherichia phage ZCEC12]|uniref:hypothetical protein n=1 Tax=Escherichia phage ZCEC10 TaxID=2894588 RepID=UPI00240E5683|nr:hypothetical protein P9622_gp56 [Escherichia phage ZCEC10]UJQ87877.1 hypothetical protein [Escherichia phage ZCEC11]UJQ87967.1 hypothetical protein [Escherichia phage ZCEC12]UJQ88060.1 hypothetical protein [Escherichia phage ZCEC10]